MKKIGFIGAGNMGLAMIKGAKTLFGDQISYTDAYVPRLEEVKALTGLPYVTDNQACVEQSDVIVLAVKPQFYNEVLTNIQANASQIFISIAPGITIQSVKDKLGSNIRVVRAMPNTPAAIGEGMSGICFSEDAFSAEERQLVIDFFNSFGKTVVVRENQMDMIVPVSGSAPAYVFIMIEAMADAAVLTGLPRKEAYELAAQTVMGAAKMVLESGKHPGQLKDEVCSPGGTTIEAVRVLEARGFRSAIIEAMDACYMKAKSFGK